jgi:Phasin protein
MSDHTFDASTWFDKYRTAFAPALRAQQEGLKAFERLARYQYAVAGDYIEFSLSAAKAAIGAKSGEDLVAAQSALSSNLSKQLQERAEEFVTIATESQNTLTNLFGEASAKAAAATKKAA